MAQTFLRTMFGPHSRALQEQDGSRTAYARMEAQAGDADILTARELDFIAARDSFYIASISEHGWPYMQHRGGPAGFLRRISGNRIGFADYQGNRQFLSTGNLAADDRVCLFLMDYPARRRLKLIGHARTTSDAEDVAALMPADYAAIGERAFVIDIVGFDWNCPQHITPRFGAADLAQITQPLQDEIARLRARIATLEAVTPQG
ncbi:putative pyridoxine 5'-phosphate oxidase superfamily flavin-nucleotide-binding protein [Novosphingobium capsulatum]|uniref:Pyridoxine 5'-phosphate oxidase superfamily flavin-nucleotide-binding protein n=1 Tax=Novosphingobium capsulatum TaxID=13688 RepID=A0ABU1ML07_9SPHN|nr:pyridoxamine 5'-phosphate oxidase family protein [Novosphingobium capsulatum]MDR6511021.1 putative pyridoxine 5'-phosphate oxidase superfamily flavin-nucleotide-binding protein [Novosphingobium capsulatum]